MKPVPIAAAKRIADEYGYDQVYVYARKVGVTGGEHMTTYGKTKEHCRVAGDAAATLQTLIGWSGDGIVGKLLRKIVPAIKRPGMYAGEQGDRSDDVWRLDAARAYVDPPKDVASVFLD